MSVSSQIAVSHFGKRAVATLAKRDIRVLGLTVIPAANAAMPFACGETGYSMDDNGCGRVWTFAQVLKAAA